MRIPAALAMVLALGLPASGQSKHEITISGTTFLVNGAPFPYNGINLSGSSLPGVIATGP